MMRRTMTAVMLAAIVAGAPVLAAQAVKVTESAPGLLKKAKIPPDSAIRIAKARLPKATINAAEIEQENGRLIYSFDFKTASKSGIDEVNVDAMTGKLVGSVQHESPSDEKKEAATDAVKAPVKKPVT
jgi:uncharacterized membrane protein YkoI